MRRGKNTVVSRLGRRNASKLVAIPMMMALLLLQAPFLGAQSLGTGGEELDRSGKPTSGGDATLHDQYGRPIHDARGERLSYSQAETEDLAPLAIEKSARTSSAQSPAVPFKNTMTIGLEWHRSIYGVGIGDTGLTAADLDGDGNLEIVAGAGPRNFFKNDFWYVMRFDGDFYPQVWA
ncbi:MAG: hypothetical protein GY769_10410, partial [bacterium]|nr:hypothetical protein [bacterium]